MFADCGRMMLQEFDTKERCLRWCINKTLGIRHSIKLLSKEKDSLMIRTPIVNEIVTIYGDEDEIKWLHLELTKEDAYTYK